MGLSCFGIILCQTNSFKREELVLNRTDIPILDYGLSVLTLLANLLKKYYDLHLYLQQVKLCRSSNFFLTLSYAVEFETLEISTDGMQTCNINFSLQTSL